MAPKVKFSHKKHFSAAFVRCLWERRQALNQIYHLSPQAGVTTLKTKLICWKINWTLTDSVFINSNFMMDIQEETACVK